MFPHLRTKFFLIPILIAAALVIVPPLSTAGNLPTACNIFHHKCPAKPGAGTNASTHSKVHDKAFETAVCPLGLELISAAYVPAAMGASFFIQAILDLPQLTPLRC